MSNDMFEELLTRMGDEEVIWVTQEEYEALQKEISLDLPPTAPVKRRSKSWGFGFFSRGGVDEVEYDHHAPLYLKALEEWEQRQRQPKVMLFFGPRMTYTIKVRS